MTDLLGASVAVTGATGALGRRIAELLAAAGARLTLTGRDSEQLAQLAAAGATGAAGATTIALDLMAPDAAAGLVEAAVTAHGGLDGIVHAAGIVAFGALDDLDDDILDELFVVNALAPMRLLRAALPHLRTSTRGPFACQLSAVVAERPLPGMAAYSASKAALTAFDAAMSTELRRAGIRVIDVRPPHTETGLAERPVAGSAPKLPPGKDPDAVAARIVAAITSDERDLPSSAF